MAYSYEARMRVLKDPYSTVYEFKVESKLCTSLPSSSFWADSSLISVFFSSVSFFRVEIELLADCICCFDFKS